MSWYTSELRVRLAPLNRFKPSIKIFYWPFQGGSSFVDLLCFCSVLCLICLCARLFICALWSPAGKGLTSWLSFVVSTVSLSLSHWYPGSGVLLDCIDLIFTPLLTLKTNLLIGAWYFGCCQAHRGLPVGFLLLRYSVLFTVESLSFLYLLLISWFICSRLWFIDTLEALNANQTSMCLDPHLN